MSGCTGCGQRHSRRARFCPCCGTGLAVLLSEAPLLLGTPDGQVRP